MTLRHAETQAARGGLVVGGGGSGTLSRLRPLLLEPFAVHADTPREAQAPSPPLRRSLRLVMSAWGFGAVWMFIVMGAATTEYARLLGVGPFGFGVLAALPFLGAFAQLPISLLIERRGRRKLTFMITGIAGRSMWLVLAAIPWLAPRPMWAPLLIGGTAVAMLLIQMGVPAWMSWAADLIPGRLRGRYMARRIRLGQMVGLVVTLLMGLGLDRAGQFEPQTVRNAISIAYAVAALAGIIDFLCHLPARARRPDAPQPIGLRRLVAVPLADRNFRRYLGFTATLTFGIGYVGQFVNLYLLDYVVVGLDSKYLLMNVMTVAIPLLVSILVLPRWGRLMDRFGRRPVMILAGALISFGGASWVLVTPQSWWFGYMTVLIATAAWPAIEVGNFNILMSLAESRRGGSGGSAYIAINSVVIALAGTLSGLFGGALAEALGEGWKGELWGWPITYHGVLMLISAGIRLVSLGFLIRIEEPGSQPTREAARYIAANIYSNVQQAVFLPGRAAVAVGRIRKLAIPRRRRGGGAGA